MMINTLGNDLKMFATLNMGQSFPMENAGSFQTYVSLPEVIYGDLEEKMTLIDIFFGHHR